MNLTGQLPYQKGQRVRSAKLRNAARDRACTLRIPGVCNGDTATVVACHLRLFSFGAMSAKPSDLLMVDGCSSCHAVLDSRDKWADAAFGYDDILRALMETITRNEQAGLIRWE